MAQPDRTETTKERLFDDLSVTQLVAGALAAATSLLLSTQIGIAGSVIGVAVGSVVSAVASNVYKYFLQVSANKIKEVTPIAGYKGSRLPNEENAGEQASVYDVREEDQTASMTTVGKDDELNGNAYTAYRPAVRNLAKYRRATARGVERTDNKTDAAFLQNRKYRTRRHQIKRRIVVISVVSALVAVGVTAALISVFTAGQGLGEKAPLLPTVSYSQTNAMDSLDSGDDAPLQEDAETTTDTQDEQNESKEEQSSNSKDDTEGTNSSNSSNSNTASDSAESSDAADSGESETGDSNQSAPSTSENTNSSHSGGSGGTSAGATDSGTGGVSESLPGGAITSGVPVEDVSRVLTGIVHR